MKIISIYFIVIVMLSLSLISCSKMNDKHQKILDKGEIIYASKLDSVSPAPGYNRIEFEMFALSQRIEKVRIYWNDSKDSLDVMINYKTGIFKQIIPNIPEGEYIFQFVSFDKFGDKSLKVEVVAQTYGDNYISRLNDRKIKNVTFIGNKIKINWNSAADIFGTLFSYENATGGINTVFISSDSTSTSLSDYKPVGAYSYKTLFKPIVNAIDTFKTAGISGTFPKYETMFDRTKFNALSLPGDEPSAWGWVLPNLWDGVIGNQGFHTGTSGNWPQVVSIDLGVKGKISRIKEFQRQGDYIFKDGNIKKFEIWGADTFDPSGSWVNWTKLMDCISVKPSGSPIGTITDADRAWASAGEVFVNTLAPDKMVRYIRIKVLESWSGDHYFHASELQVFGDTRF